MGSALPGVALLVTSPLDRCRQSAEIIAESASISEIRVDERLIELDYGDLDLVPMRDIPSEVWKAWQADADFRPPGGESLNEMATRVESCLDELWPQSATGDIAVVTHVSPIKAAVAWALRVPIDISWRCRVSQASITKLGSGAGGPSLHSFNDTAHLVETG